MVSKTLLDKYKKRLDYLAKFHKLCRSVQLISLSKLQRLNYRIKDRQSSLEIFKLFFNVKQEITNVNRYLILVLSTDRTCCNLLNGNIWNVSKKVIDYLVEYKKEVHLVSFGGKGKVFFQDNFRRIHKKAVKNLIPEPITFPFMSLLFDQLVKYDYTDPFNFFYQLEVDKYLTDRYKRKKRLLFDKCLVFYNRYISIMKQQPAVYTLFSFDILKNIYIHGNGEFCNIFFQSIKENYDKYLMLRELIFFGYSLVLLDCFEENEICEYAARANVMKHAYNASKDMMAELKIVYNKIRQELITRELNELVTAAEASSSMN